MSNNSSSLDRFDDRMKAVETGSFRYDILRCAKNFKSSWLDLGRFLTAVKKDRMFRDWGYLSFEAYCVKEVGIRKATGDKLLRSYFFMEREEPGYLKPEHLDNAEAPQVPSFETVDTLRKVKENKEFSISDYQNLKKQVFEEGRDEKQIKDAYRALLKNVREEDPEEARAERRRQHIGRMLSYLRTVKRELESSKLLPGPILEDVDKIIERIQSELVEVPQQ